MSFPYKIKRRESTFAFPALVVFTQKKDYSQSLSLSVLSIELDLLPALLHCQLLAHFWHLF